MKPVDPGRCWAPLLPFENARSGFRALLEALGFSHGQGTVLLPSFIGWSRREGSGVFDPVRDVGARFRFFRLGRDLSIDIEGLTALLNSNDRCLVVLIHYYGFPCRGTEAAVEAARQAGALVLEDEAHALLSERVGGVCGTWGDAALYSYHKMFPVEWGGAVRLQQSLGDSVFRSLEVISRSNVHAVHLSDYDLKEISNVRLRNAKYLLARLGDFDELLKPLFPAIPIGVVPQTLPVVVVRGCRDDIYYWMNEAGFGVVSLYHTLIPEIPESDFAESHWLSKRVLNLPVHQDVTTRDLDELLQKLRTVAERD